MQVHMKCCMKQSDAASEWSPSGPEARVHGVICSLQEPGQIRAIAAARIRGSATPAGARREKSTPIREGRGVLVDLDGDGAVRRGLLDETRRRVDDGAGADGEEEVAASGKVRGGAQGVAGERLPEPDDGGAHVAAPLALGRELRESVGAGAPLALGGGAAPDVDGAVELDDARAAGALMQAVDVLREDDEAAAAGAEPGFHVGEGEVAGFGSAARHPWRRQSYQRVTRAGSAAKASGVASFCGSKSFQRPSMVSRNVRIPLSAEIPAPVSTPTDLAVASRAATASICSSMEVMTPLASAPARRRRCGAGT